MNRRDFLKISAPAIGFFAFGLTSGQTRATSVSDYSPSDQKMAILYDSSKCIGCHTCEAACRMENHLPKTDDEGTLSKSSWTAIQSIPLPSSNSGQKVFLKRQCMHCAEASCIAVCPTGAASRRNGYTEISQEWCIGCGYCEESCPFGVPHREPPGGTAQKCTFCIERVTSGLKPACVAACPSGALTAGMRSDIVESGTTRARELAQTEWPQAQLYGANELGGLSVLYVLIKPPDFYGLPQQPRKATGNILAQWTSGSLAAAALILPFWIFFKRGNAKPKSASREGQQE